MMLLYMSAESQFKNFIEMNYGSIYKTTGGGMTSFKGANVKKWVKKILGNRLFDLYLKYIGIKTLTTASLVPLSLILSRDLVEKMIQGDQSGGFIAKDIPILDNHLVGLYLKLAGLTLLDLTTSTLLPLGVVMIIYDLSLNNKVNKKILNKKGGGRLLWGTSTPPNFVQKMHQYISSDSMPEPLFHHSLADPDVNNQLQLTAYNNVNKPIKVTIPPAKKPPVHNFLVAKSPGNNVLNKYYANLEPPPPVNFNDGSIDNPGKGTIVDPNKGNIPNKNAYPGNIYFPTLPDSNDYYFNMGQNDAANNYNHLEQHNSNGNIKWDAPVSMAGGSKKKKNQKGSGSDWMSSQYSAGPVNSPPMSKYQLGAFNSTYSGNEVFSKHYQKVPPLVLETPLSDQYHLNAELSASQYGSSLEPNELHPDIDVPYNVVSSKYRKNKKKTSKNSK